MEKFTACLVCGMRSATLELHRDPLHMYCSLPPNSFQYPELAESWVQALLMGFWVDMFDAMRKSSWRVAMHERGGRTWQTESKTTPNANYDNGLYRDTAKDTGNCYNRLYRGCYKDPLQTLHARNS